jgi:Immunoglobulin-like domain of bacterial spore germination
MGKLLKILILAILGAAIGCLLRRCRRAQERIEIDSPSSLAVVTSPLMVAGVGEAAQHNMLSVRVRDQSGTEIGNGTVSIMAALGERGPFSGSISYTLSGGPQPGRIEIYDVSPRDGNLVHLSSVEVTLA